jgi:type IV pilus assembly protein PilA
MRNSKMKGFTLIELIVVIAIIGVLAAILVPSMIGYVGQSKLSTANANAKLAFTNSATYCTKCEVEGNPCGSGTTISSYSIATTTPTPMSAADYDGSDTKLKLALDNLMGGAPNAGVVSVTISSAGAPTDAKWAKTTADKYVGGYPTAASAKSGETGGLTL